MAMSWIVFVLILLWYSMWRHYASSGHRQNYFLQCGQTVRANAWCIFLSCLCSQLLKPERHSNLGPVLYNKLQGKITFQNGIFYSEEWSFKISSLQKIYAEKESKIKIIPCADFLNSVNWRVNFFKRWFLA